MFKGFDLIQQQDAGATFVTADLHVHSFGFSSDVKGKRPLSTRLFGDVRLRMDVDDLEGRVVRPLPELAVTFATLAIA